MARGSHARLTINASPFFAHADGEAFASHGAEPTMLKVAPEHPLDWLTEMFPRHFPNGRAGFAERHKRFWQHAHSIEPGAIVRPYAEIAPRGGGKTTEAEALAVYLGGRGKRKYGLYVKGVQKQADQAVANIGNMLVSGRFAAYYPEHADRALSKYGHSKGWTRNLLRTSGGLTIEAVGLDGPTRGVKDDEQRPDFIIFDDVDDRYDSPLVQEKKIGLITTSIMPAGSRDAAIFVVQNVIHKSGFVGRIVTGTADYLRNAIVAGPEPALLDFDYEQRWDEALGRTIYVVKSGVPTWSGQSVETCEKQMNEWGIDAFKREAQHDVFGSASGLALKYDSVRHNVTLTDAEVRSLVARGTPFGAVDFGHWRFACNLFVAHVSRGADDDAKARARVTRIDGFLSQDEAHLTRAKTIDDMVKAYGIAGPLILWGDAANPQDIKELNLRLVEIGSKVRVVAVGMENKLRRPGVTRINDMLARGLLLNRANSPRDHAWTLHKNVGSSGIEMRDISRWQWEAEHWEFPVPKAGEAQTDDPDDDTADGGDAMATTRYAIMSWWKPPQPKPEQQRTNEHQHPGHRQDASGRNAVANDRRPLGPSAPARPARVTPFQRPKR